MKLFIIDKSNVEKEVGADNLKIAHQECYGKLSKSIDTGFIPLFLNGFYDEDNMLQFVFNRVDRENDIYFYNFQFITGS